MRPGVVEVKASRRNGTLCLTVSDNGKGLPGNAAPQDGIGLSNTRARLQHLYGNHHQLLLENRPEGGLAVTIELPLRSQPEY